MTTTITPEGLAPFVLGAGSLEPGTQGGVAVHRLPAWARDQVEDALFAFAESSPSGVIVRGQTTAERVDVTLSALTVTAEGQPAAAPLCVAHHGDQWTEIPVPQSTVVVLGPGNVPVDMQPAGPQILSIPTPGGGLFELHLPHTARIELHALAAEGDLVPALLSGKRWTHYGSSISHGLNAVSPVRTWPVAASIALGWNLHNLSFSGNAQLDGFAARLIRDTPAELITLKVGINLINSDSMRARTFRPALNAFLDTIREGQPETPIMLISAVSCPIHEHTPGPVVDGEAGQMRAAHREVEHDDGALTLASTREILDDVVRRRTTGDNPDLNLTYLDGRMLFGDDDTALLYDSLHPNQEGLDLIAQRFVARMQG